MRGMWKEKEMIMRKILNKNIDFKGYKYIMKTVKSI